MRRVLFQLSAEDVPYVNLLKGLFKPTGLAVGLNSENPTTVTEVVLRAKEQKAEAIITSNPVLLKLLLQRNGVARGNLDDYAGSVFDHAGMEILIVHPVLHLVSVSYGRFLYNRYLDKLLHKEKWFQPPEFKWKLFEEADTDFYVGLARRSHFIAADIETGDMDLREITCISFTFIELSANTLLQHTVVIPFNNEHNLHTIRRLLASPAVKVFQNGKYDNAYLLRFGSPAVNWSGDTLNLFHCWYSELPKDLGFLASFMLRKWEFWKDESKTSDLMEYYAYNAKDSFSTAMIWIAMMLECPAYVWNNYKQEFPIVFPCLMTELIGLARDSEAMEREEKRFNASMDVRLQKLRVMTATSTYNPSSSKQTLELYKILGSADIKSTDARTRDKVANRHPLNKVLLDEIESYREDRKLVTGYLRDEDSKGRRKTWNGRIFYSLNPHGTDTGRLASRSSAFWCGWQIQNIPRDRDDIQVKEGIISDAGFYLGEVDYAQNEARGTAYLSGDEKLIAAVDDRSKDFHGRNASAFFGIPYESIVDSQQLPSSGEWVHKVLDKALRDLSKRTNHGANYNMGPEVMLMTMGIKNVLRAQTVLGLPSEWAPVRVCEFLLASYAKTYSVVKGAWYDKCINDVSSSGFLIGPTGWTRRCFGNPKAHKHHLNAYVAHPPQSLAAMQLNLAYLSVFSNIALVEPEDFKLGPQIHDSILFQYRKGRVDLVKKVQKCMVVPLEVKDTFGKIRTLIVPTDAKGEAERWSELKAIH